MTLGLVLFGVIFGLILAEIGLRIIPDQQLDNIIYHSARGRHFYTVNRDIGWVLRPNLVAEWETRDQLFFEVTTNSQGLRDDETPYDNQNGTFRILLLGDSLAEAMQVNLADAFPTTLESCLGASTAGETEVINAGVTAYSLGEEVLFYQAEGVKYGPNLVFGSGFGRNRSG